MKKMKKILSVLLLLTIIASCTKNEDYGKLKFEIIIDSPVDILIDQIEYTNLFNNYNTINDITGNQWILEQEYRGSSLEYDCTDQNGNDAICGCGTFQYMINSSPQPFTVTKRIYLDGELVNEEVDQATEVNDPNGTYYTSTWYDRFEYCWER